MPPSTDTPTVADTGSGSLDVTGRTYDVVVGMYTVDVAVAIAVAVAVADAIIRGAMAYCYGGTAMVAMAAANGRTGERTGGAAGGGSGHRRCGIGMRRRRRKIGAVEQILSASAVSHATGGRAGHGSIRRTSLFFLFLLRNPARARRCGEGDEDEKAGYVVLGRTAAAIPVRVRVRESARSPC